MRSVPEVECPLTFPRWKGISRPRWKGAVFIRWRAFMSTWFVTLAILLVAWGSASADVPPPPNDTKAEREEWQRAREANQRARFRFPPAPVLVPQSKTKELPFVVNATAGIGWMRLVLPAKLVQELQTAQTGSGSFQVLGGEQIPTLI